MLVKTKCYLLKICVSTPRGTFRGHLLVCYGLDITDVQRYVTAKKLQEFFPDIPLSELVRPREIHLLVSHKEGKLASQNICTVGDLDRPLGKTFAGTHRDLFDEVAVSAHMS